MHSKVVESLSLWILLLGASVGTSEKRNIETVDREDSEDLPWRADYHRLR